MSSSSHRGAPYRSSSPCWEVVAHCETEFIKNMCKLNVQSWELEHVRWLCSLLPLVTLEISTRPSVVNRDADDTHMAFPVGSIFAGLRLLMCHSIREVLCYIDIAPMLVYPMM